MTGRIEGTVTDESGRGVAGAQVRLTLVDQGLTGQATCDGNGAFSFSGLASGPFELTITATGFTSQTVSGSLHAGEVYTVPRIVLGLPAVVTEVKVTPPPAEMAKYQLEIEEKQRVLAIFPNFYVSYFKDTAPLSRRQKFRLAAKTLLDPVNIGITAAVAGVEQDANRYSEFGQGAQGYAKRFGAAYADDAIGTMIGNAILPSLLKQDPRYFYKGTGSWQSRFLYAVTRAVICKGDNGRWQPAYSSFVGSLAAGSISNLYYPEQNRSGVKLTVENALIGLGSDAIINVIQEFLIPKLAPPPVAASQPAGN
ncbi:MAG TPA: carboxypeptidase-like regulatory domain-containing protein [Terriglobia bacterium]|nr:carboxypeptidase-like regulatory domain-containing protein [Terriglobia bacterium]